jgi:hypothetical protein
MEYGYEVYMQFGAILILMRTNQLPNMIVIVVVLTTITLITIFNNQMATGSFDDSRSILPEYREGYEVGKVQGMEDHLGSEGHVDRCPQEKVTILWCIGYEIGYNDGYYDPEILSGN